MNDCLRRQVERAATMLYYVTVTSEMDCRIGAYIIRGRMQSMQRSSGGSAVHDPDMYPFSTVTFVLLRPK